MMNEKLTLQDLVDLLAQKAKISKKEADTFFKELFAVITENIYENEPVKIKDFGVFKLTPVSSRESVNVNTGEKIEIPAHYRLSFQPDKTLKELVNKPFASFETVPLDDEETVVRTPSIAIQDVVLPTETVVKEVVVEEIIEDDDDNEIEDQVENKNVVVEPKEEVIAPLVVATPKAKEQISIPRFKVEIESKPKEKIEEVSKPIVSSSLNNLSVSPKYVYSYTAHQADSLAENDITVSNFVQETTSLSSNIDRFEDFEKVVASKKDEGLPIQGTTIDEIEEKTVLAPLPEIAPDASNLQVEEAENIVEINKTSADEIDNSGNPVERGLLPEYDPEEDEYEDEEDADMEEVEEIDYDKIPDFYAAKPSLWSRILKKTPIVLFVLIALAAIAYSFLSLFDVKYGYENFLNKTNLTATDTLPHGGEGIPHVVTLDSVLDETTKKLDSLKSDQKNEPVIADPYATTPGVNIENVNKAEAKYKSLQNAGPDKIGSEVLKSGVTLRNLSEKYYGQGVFWVYIYEENKNVISDPDNVPVGVTVVIPDPAKYEIDAKNKASRDEAKELENQIISEARQKRFARGGIR